MYDRFNRKINYLRISVTDRCNLRCKYCMPVEGVDLMKHEDLLSFEEIVDVVRESVEKGITKVRLTGGEPLVRKGIVKLVQMISDVEGVIDLAMTTNGVLLEKYAADLFQAGLKRVNISLDTLDNNKYFDLTRGGKISDVFRGIEKAIEVGFDPIKINCVIMKSSDEPDALAVKEFTKLKGLKVRFIHQMDLESGEFSKVEGGEGGECLSCNRIRLSASGGFKPCLFNDSCFNIKEFGIKGALEKAVQCKPKSGSKNKSGKFYNIGG
ncbi:MAG: radical SAM protein [Prolixibacteraceae bacterium]|jgi:cyclic pyranopterin phosphate synthase|nr:radical SAM protein [Prolixibacteraceae bacterium]